MATLRARRFQDDELFWILDREPAQEHLIQERENGGVRADSQSEGHYRNCGEPRILQQHPEAVSHVLPQRVHCFLSTLPRASKCLIHSEAQPMGPRAY